jgi:hypothetical protein
VIVDFLMLTYGSMSTDFPITGMGVNLVVSAALTASMIGGYQVARALDPKNPARLFIYLTLWTLGPVLMYLALVNYSLFHMTLGWWGLVLGGLGLFEMRRLLSLPDYVKWDKILFIVMISSMIIDFLYFLLEASP